MDDSLALPSEGFLISQILGVKTPLCFRPCKSTQKPHAVLRRVETSDDSSDDGEEPSSFVHFKLFAQKRFTITPGKEILLTVEDDRFKDNAVSFCGTKLTSDESEMQESVKATQEGAIPPLLKNALPPKIRRAWVKKADERASTRKSTGIQATPTTCSTYVQAQPPCRTVSIQSNPSSAVTSVQTMNSTCSVSVQAEIVPSSSVPTSNQQQPRIKDRSLSPMDLDSSGSDSTSLSPRTPEFEPSPVQSSRTPLMSPSTPDIRPSLMDNDEDDMQISPKVTIVAAERGHPIDPLHAEISRSIFSPPSLHKSNLTDDNTSRALKEVTRKSPVYNHFVSAGFVTEFTGETRATMQYVKEHIEDSPFNLLDAVRRVDTSNLAVVKSIFDNEFAVRNSVEISPVVNMPQLPKKSQASTDTNLSAIKIKEEGNANDSVLLADPCGLIEVKEKERELTTTTEITSIPVQQKGIPTGPRNAVASSSKVMLEHSNFTPTLPRAPRSLRNKVDEGTPSPNSLAVLSSSPYANPLGIKPSKSMSTTSAPAGPKTLAGVQTKKCVVIGIGTPISRTIVENNCNSPVSSRPLSAPKSPNLVAYFSPSPPPTTPVPPTYTPPANTPKPPPPPAVQIKWKRLPELVTTSPGVNGKGSLPERISPSNSRTANPILADEIVPSLYSTLDSPNRSPTSPILTDISLELKRSPIISEFTPLSPVPPLTSRLSLPSNPTETLQNTCPINVPLHEHPTVTSSISTNSSANGTVSSPSSSAPWNAAATINPVNLPSLSGTFSADLLPSAPQIFHPLPPKPVASVMPRGVKRERPPSPNVNEPVDIMRGHKRSFRWPTLESNHSTLLRGEGDLTILNIAGTRDGALLALNCADKTIRIWDNNTRTEMARLTHNARVASVLWLDDDSGIISLGEDGMISRWSRTSFNHWTWAQMVDIGVKPNYQEKDSGMRLAYFKDKVAVSLPSVGVKVWFWSKGAGCWQAQRPILRPNVTALTFIEDGSTLLGGTVDGVLWACEIPNGIIRACAFLKAKIFSIDVNPAKTQALISCHGVSRLIGLQAEKRGKLEQSYVNKDTESSPHQVRTFGACFTARGQGVLFGDIKGCALIWDAKKGSLVYGLDHGLREEGCGEEVVTAAASLDSPNGGCIVTGTKTGLLSWWSQPAYANTDFNKKAKVS